MWEREGVFVPEPQEERSVKEAGRRCRRGNTTIETQVESSGESLADTTTEAPVETPVGIPSGVPG
jgi:hypothetical protein